MVSITQLPTLEETHEQEVALVIPSTGDAARLQKFIYQTMKIFQAGIVSMVGSWSETQIIFKLKWPVPMENILDELVKMPEVENAEEKRAKIQDIPRQRIQVTLDTNSTNDDHETALLISDDADISKMDFGVDSQLDT